MPARYQIGEASLTREDETLREALLVHEKTPSRSRATPILAGITDRSSFRNNVQEPSASSFGGRIELYFVGLQFWFRPRQVVSSLPTGFDNWGCMSPTVVREADRWVLFYTALENSRQRPGERWGRPLGQDGWLFGTLGRAESITSKGSANDRSAAQGLNELVT